MRIFRCPSCTIEVSTSFAKCKIQMATGDARLDILPIKVRPGYCHTCVGMTSFAVFSVDEDTVPNPIDDLAVAIERERDKLIALSRNVPTWLTLQKRFKHQKRKKRDRTSIRGVGSENPPSRVSALPDRGMHGIRYELLGKDR